MIFSDFLTHQSVERAIKIQLAHENNELMECPCCCNDELLVDDMLSCDDCHLFCHMCIRRSSEELIGQSKTKFPCLSDGCSGSFTLKTLKKVLPANVLSNLLRRIQEEEVRNAGIEDLETCPFCSFATIIPNKDDKVFHCLNPECMKESCR